MSNGDSKRKLWEPEHAYYCSTSNYYSNDCTTEYPSWDSFLSAEGDSDLDMNLVFRWDWDREEKELSLFYMGQRKGLFRAVVVRNMLDEREPEVRAWLTTRWEYLRKLWAPLSCEASSG